MRSKGSLWRSVLSPAQGPLLAPVVSERMLTHLAPDPDFFSNTGDNLSPSLSDGESDYLAPQERSNNKGGMIAGTVIGVLLGVAALLGLLFWLWRKRQAHNNKASTSHGIGGHGQVQPSTPTTSNAPNKTKGEAEFMVNVHGDFKGVKLPESSGSINSSNSVQSSTPTQRGTNSFTYEEVFEATNGFSKSNVIGQGGFGHVYQGVLSSGKIVAIKQLKVGSHQGEREFLAEIDTISHIHHRNLVSLIGYSIEKNQKLLVYEYMANNSLAYHLHGSEPQSVLSWDLRMQIAVGSAKGLAYLHEDCDPKIIHRDIKANNILLDSNFNAKVSDFGLAKFVAEAETHVTTRVMGTFGYLAPEYASSGKLTEKSDVYSFGIVLLELISGRPPLNLVEWVRPLLPHALTHDIYDELADPKLNNCYDNVGMGRMLACVEACIHPFAHNRPQMVQVARVLQGIMSPSDLQRQS